jgi:hypothetical protein
MTGRDGITIKRFAVNDTSNEALDSLKDDAFFYHELSANNSEVLVGGHINTTELNLDYQRDLMCSC